MASDVHKNTDTKVEPSVQTRFAVSCRRKLPNRGWQLQLRLRMKFNGHWQYEERFRG